MNEEFIHLEKLKLRVLREAHTTQLGVIDEEDKLKEEYVKGFRDGLLRAFDQVNYWIDCELLNQKKG